MRLSDRINGSITSDFTKILNESYDLVESEDSTKGEEALKTLEDQLERNWKIKTEVGIEESEELIIDDEKELAKYIAAHYEEITGVKLEDLFNKAEIEDSSEPIFNQNVIDETFDKIVNFIKDYNESNGTNYDSNNEDFLDLLDDELLKVREPIALNETTNKELRARHEAYREKQRQALRDAGDPNPESTVGIAKRLPPEVWNELDIEGTILDCIQMIHSILTYAPDNNRTLEYVLDSRYIKKYIEKLGEEKVREIANQEVEEYKNATINTNAYTDSEGVTYNSVTFKDE